MKRYFTLADIARSADYSLLTSLSADPQNRDDGKDHDPRQVFSGHFVCVAPTPLPAPEYISHSKRLFDELGFAESLATSNDFTQLFTGNLSELPAPLQKTGWATGYAVSIFGTEYYQQCIFKTGNGYGDGRAISILEGVFNDRRWEMQLKGAGRTPYCRGADGRAVLRSSVREFLAQEHMHALGVPTSRSLSLFVSKDERVKRPWYSAGSQSTDPDQMMDEPVAITTRVAPSFIRVGQIELFARRARKKEHIKALLELEQLLQHLIEREYANEIPATLSMPEKVLLLAEKYRDRLVTLVSDWMRVGYCQGNFNSDNCAAGGFTLDYGPFGFCETFEPYYQPWTGGGEHFSWWNQPIAAERNYAMFCQSLRPVLSDNNQDLQHLDNIQNSFASVMQEQLEIMWSRKLGLEQFDATLFRELLALMMNTPVDYTLFFRELSHIPPTLEPLRKSFYRTINAELEQRWTNWLKHWQSKLTDKDAVAAKMKQTNPKYVLREWLLVPAYQQAAAGDYSLIQELQTVMTNPYDEQSAAIEQKFYRLKADEYSNLGGFSHMSCSS